MKHSRNLNLLSQLTNIFGLQKKHEMGGWEIAKICQLANSLREVKELAKEVQEMVNQIDVDLSVLEKKTNDQTYHQGLY